MIYDLIIIGSGISGLYICYKLLKKNKSLKILILEKNNYYGGRIKTFEKKINNHKYKWEEGAGRFNDNHHLFLKLINDLNLNNEIIKISSKTTFIPSTKYDKKFLDSSPFLYINKVIDESKKISDQELQKYTFKEYAKKILKNDEWKFIVDSYGYYGELIYMNAYDAINLFKDGMNPDLQFYSLKCGFSYLIHTMVQFIIKNGGTIILNSHVENINYENKEFIINTIENNKNKHIYNSKICVAAIPKPNLLKLNIFKPVFHYLKSISIESLCRIYSIFKKDDIWFKELGKITSNNDSRYIIPIDSIHGLIMISYTDSKYADKWNKIYNKDKDLFNNNIKNNVKKILNITINDPIYTKMSYWDIGVAMWKKNYNSKIISKKIIKPLNNIPLFIAGENYSNYQGWIEGSLETSEKIIKILNKKKLKKY